MSDFTSIKPGILREPFQVGRWQVQPSLDRIIAIGDRLNCRALEPRLMHLLCLLADRPGTLLTREELIAGLWPRVIVNENSLTRAVCELRKKLHDPQSDNLTYVETIPKKGYRLVQPVSKLPDETRSAFPGEETPMAPIWFRKLGPSGSPGLTSALILFIAIASLQFLPRPVVRTQAINPDSRLVYDQVIDAGSSLSGGELRPSSLETPMPFASTNLAGNEPVISPDGSTLAYLRGDGKQSFLLLRKLDAAEPPVTVYTSLDRLYNLQWSPVGNALLFAASPQVVAPTLLGTVRSQASLMMLDLDTLTVRVLLDHRPDSKDATNTV